jgi:hypothetical protein
VSLIAQRVHVCILQSLSFVFFFCACILQSNFPLHFGYCPVSFCGCCFSSSLNLSAPIEFRNVFFMESSEMLSESPFVHLMVLESGISVLQSLSFGNIAHCN